MELSSPGKDTIALDAPNISYFSATGSCKLEESCWDMGNELLTSIFA